MALSSISGATPPPVQPTASQAPAAQPAEAQSAEVQSTGSKFLDSVEADKLNGGANGGGRGGIFGDCFDPACQKIPVAIDPLDF